MGTVSITVADGVRYAVTDDRPNASDAIVCLHGFTGSKQSWAFLDQLLPDSRVIKIDCLGHGESDAPLNGKRYSTSRQVSDLAEIFDHLKLHKVKLIGYSMGEGLHIPLPSHTPNGYQRLCSKARYPALKPSGNGKNESCGIGSLPILFCVTGSKPLWTIGKASLCFQRSSGLLKTFGKGYGRAVLETITLDWPTV